MSQVTKDEKAVRQIRNLYTIAFGNRELKFRYQTNGSNLFQIIAYDRRGSATVIDSIATRDMAVLMVGLLTATAAGAKQLALLVAD
jgi:hypothetical protein